MKTPIYVEASFGVLYVLLRDANGEYLASMPKSRMPEAHEIEHRVNTHDTLTAERDALLAQRDALVGACEKAASFMEYVARKNGRIYPEAQLIKVCRTALVLVRE
jgi:hypothetical protein